MTTQKYRAYWEAGGRRLMLLDMRTGLLHTVLKLPAKDEDCRNDDVRPIVERLQDSIREACDQIVEREF